MVAMHYWLALAAMTFLSQGAAGEQWGGHGVGNSPGANTGRYHQSGSSQITPNHNHQAVGGHAHHGRGHRLDRDGPCAPLRKISCKATKNCQWHVESDTCSMIPVYRRRYAEGDKNRAELEAWGMHAELKDMECWEAFTVKDCVDLNQDFWLLNGHDVAEPEASKCEWTCPDGDQSYGQCVPWTGPPFKKPRRYPPDFGCLPPPLDADCPDPRPTVIQPTANPPIGSIEQRHYLSSEDCTGDYFVMYRVPPPMKVGSEAELAATECGVLGGIPGIPGTEVMPESNDTYFINAPTMDGRTIWTFCEGTGTTIDNPYGKSLYYVTLGNGNTPYDADICSDRHPSMIFDDLFDMCIMKYSYAGFISHGITPYIVYGNPDSDGDGDGLDPNAHYCAASGTGSSVGYYDAKNDMRPLSPNDLNSMCYGRGFGMN